MASPEREGPLLLCQGEYLVSSPIEGVRASNEGDSWPSRIYQLR